MITALDHIVLVCPDIEEGAAAYELVLGMKPSWRAEADGAATAWFQMPNVALELMAPSGDGETADKLREMTSDGGKLTSIVYRSDTLEADHRLLTRRGLAPTEISDGQSRDIATGEPRSLRRFRIPDANMSGVKSFVLERAFDLPSSSELELDHIVIDTPNPERALATYGARLGLDLRLDRTAEQWNVRFLFFKLGGVTLEVVHRLGHEYAPDAPDQFGGLTWAVKDLEAAHARLSDAGRNVSEIRTGRKPGSRVFTLRDGTLGVPTLFIHHAPR